MKQDKLEEGYNEYRRLKEGGIFMAGVEVGGLADGAREATECEATEKELTDWQRRKYDEKMLSRKVKFKVCPICGKYLAGTHKKVCRKNNRKKWFKWFLRKIIKR